MTDSVSHRSCVGPEDPLRADAEGVVAAAVGAHVEHEQVEVLAARDPAVDPTGRVAVAAAVDEGADRHRHVLLPRAASAGGQHVAAALGVAVVVEDLAGIPVVAGLVVVPLRDRRDVGVQRPDVGVLQDVALPAAELLERLGDLLDAVADQVAPDVTALLLDGRRDLEVGVDRVAAVHEQVGLGPVDRGVRREPAELLVDPEALAAGVARPHQRGGRRVDRRGAEADPLGLAGGAVVAGERDGGVVPPAGREPVQLQPRGVVGARVGPGTAHGSPAAARCSPAGPPSGRRPDERAQSTAESVVTSPERAPWVSATRDRTWPGARPGHLAAEQTGRGTDAHASEESRSSTDPHTVGHASRAPVAAVRTEMCACRVGQPWMSAERRRVPADVSEALEAPAPACRG